MAFYTTRTRWMGALIALLVAVFAFAPVAEAAECGVEMPAATASLALDLHQDNGPDKQPAHDDCAHGHCHHASVLGTPEPDELDVGPGICAEHSFPLDDMRVLHAPDGLKRPPRV